MKYEFKDFCKLCLTSSKSVVLSSISKKADKATALVLMAIAF